MNFLYSLSIRKKLLFLILAAVVPALAIILVSGIERRESEIASTKRDILHLSKSLAAQQEQLAAGTKQMLKMLAQRPEVQQIDARACNRLFRDVHEQNPIYAIINAVTPDGEMFAASVPFAPDSVNLTDRKHIRDAIRTRDFSAGEFIVGKVVTVPTILYSYPVLDKNGKLIAVLSAGIKLDKYKEFMAQLNLPEGSVTSISDHRNITLYRLPERKDIPPGTPIPLQNVKGIPPGSKEGFYEAVGRDNVSRIFAYKRLWLRDNESPYLMIYVGVAKNVAIRHANTQLVYNLIFLGIACLLAMLLAWVAGNSIIVGPLNKLVTATKRFGEGEMHVRTDLAHREDELGRLADSFDAMAVMLETKDLSRRKAEEALRESEQRLKTLMDAAPIAITWADTEGNQKYMNRKHYELFGYTLEEIPTVAEWRRRAYPDPVYRETVPSFFAAYKQGKESVSFEAVVTCKNGSQRHVIGLGAVVPDMLLLILDDITERKRMEHQLQTMSLTDELTGLYNRRGFLALSGQQLKIAARTKKDILLFFTDLDKMKLINDTLGHQEGDKVLAEVAAILKEVFRESDIVGRMGGDEFAVLAIDTADKTGEALKTRLYDTVANYNKYEGRSYQLSLSVGIARYKPETPSTLDELMAQADTLMYEEKKNKQQ